MVIPPWRFSRLSNEGVSLTNQKSLRAVALLAGELAGAFNRHSPDASQTGVNSSAFPASLEANRRYRINTNGRSATPDDGI
jgi:hypothetical protein